MNQDQLHLRFSAVYDVKPSDLQREGLFDIALGVELPMFIDPFLLFNNHGKKEYQELHAEMINYLIFLRNEVREGHIDRGLTQAWFHFKEIRQTWLGFCQEGNFGRGLGQNFADAIKENFGKLFSEENDRITDGHHIEKLCLIAGNVGRDTISDFTTNLIKHYLLQRTEDFSKAYVKEKYRKKRTIRKVRFNYDTKSWVDAEFDLPCYGSDYIILVPIDLLTRDNTWINRSDLLKDYEDLPEAMNDEALKAQVNHYFRSRLVNDNPKPADVKRAREDTILKFPELIDYYIKNKENTGERATSIADENVKEVEDIVGNFREELLVGLIQHGLSDFAGDSYDNSRKRLLFLKDCVENHDLFKLFWDGDTPRLRREADFQLLFRLVWHSTDFDVNREPNNGRGPVDYTVSKGSRDKTVIEFKLGKSGSLKRNLQHQAEIYASANSTKKKLKVILCFTQIDSEKTLAVLEDLGLKDDDSIILIDARKDNKPSASKAHQH